MRKLSSTSMEIVDVTLRPLSASSTTHNLLQTLGRADVLNLTSVEPGNNHPKLYRELHRVSASIKSPVKNNQDRAQYGQESIKLIGEIRLRPGPSLKAARGQGKRFYRNKNAALRPHPCQNNAKSSNIN